MEEVFARPIYLRCGDLWGCGRWIFLASVTLPPLRKVDSVGFVASTELKTRKSYSRESGVLWASLDFHDALNVRSHEVSRTIKIHAPDSRDGW